MLTTESLPRNFSRPHMRKLPAFLAATSALIMAAGVQAASIRFESRDSDAPVISTSSPTNYATGVLHYSTNATEGGGSFDAWCIEPEQSIAIRALGYKTYSVGSFTSRETSLLQGLFSTSFASLSNGTEKAAFQIAIWEALRETGSLLDANVGSFHITNPSSSTTAALTAASITSLANGYLASAQAYRGPALYSLTKLSSGVYQDLVVASAVPEPGSLALLLAGVAVVGGVVRRRSPR